MEESPFSTELASVSDLADRWGVALHQISYIIRSRRIAPTKVVGTTRLFGLAQQQTIYNTLHRYLPNEGRIELAPAIPELAEQEEHDKDQMLETMAALKADNEDLKMRVAALEADMALLKKLVLRGPEEG
jgi:hypothetical protein